MEAAIYVRSLARSQPEQPLALAEWEERAQVVGSNGTEKQWNLVISTRADIHSSSVCFCRAVDT